MWRGNDLANRRHFEAFRMLLTHAIYQKPTTRTADHLTSRGIGGALTFRIINHRQFTLHHRK
jgi:hypothetical protein